MIKKIYTTYLANAKRIPEGVKKVFIARYIPRSLDLTKEEIKHMPALSPSDSLRTEFKSGKIEHYEFCDKLEGEILSRPLAHVSLDGIAHYMMENNEDVCLICYEKESQECHRNLVATLLAGKLTVDADIIEITNKGVK